MCRSTGYPGYDSVIGPENATIAEILKENGYAMSWFGKEHNTRCTHGFLRARDGTVTTFDVPGAGRGFNQGTAAFGITPAMQSWGSTLTQVICIMASRCS